MNLSPYRRKVHYYETDQMGIVHHSNYIRWFEEARVDYLEQVDFGYQKAMEADIDFAVLSVRCTYKSMIRFGDTIKIFLNVADLKMSRITLSYQVMDDATDKLRAFGESEHCYYHNIRKRPVSLKKELPDLYMIFQSAMVANCHSNLIQTS